MKKKVVSFMAMISCPNCGGQISDKASKCIHCGFVLKSEELVERRCAECGTVIPDGVEVCPNCGCPVEQIGGEAPQKVEVTNVKISIDDKKKKSVIGVIAVIIIIIATFIGYRLYSTNAAKKAYQENYEKCVTLMLDGAGKAESSCNLIHDVWYNTIYEKDSSATDKYTKTAGKFNDDFNKSLMMLMVDDNFISDISDIESNQDTVQEIMKSMKNPPEGFEDAYDALKAFYDSYTKIINMAINPSGNLNSYTSNFNDADTQVINDYKAASLYMEDN